MPAITEKQTVEVIKGMICDVCETRDDIGCNTFNVDHTFGYGVWLDGHSVSFSVCDLCLAKLVFDRIPKAQFRSNCGSYISMEEAKMVLFDNPHVK
jgi:hypothetical protein